VYEIVTVPDAIAVRLPVAGLIVALELLADHVPPGVPLESAIVDPTHTLSDPVIVDGNGFTVVAALAWEIHPSLSAITMWVCMPATVGL
jgi:hypothetical protein